MRQRAPVLLAIAAVAALGCSNHDLSNATGPLHPASQPRSVIGCEVDCPPDYVPPSGPGDTSPPDWGPLPGTGGGSDPHVGYHAMAVGFGNSRAWGEAVMKYWATSWSQVMTLEVWENGTQKALRTFPAGGSRIVPQDGLLKTTGYIPITKACGLTALGLTVHRASMDMIGTGLRSEEVTSEGYPVEQAPCAYSPTPSSGSGGESGAGAVGSGTCWYLTRINEMGEVISETFIDGPAECPR